MLLNYYGKHYDLSKAHTKTLLNLLRGVSKRFTNDTLKSFEVSDSIRDKLRSELVTREHVLNKPERKQMRIAKMELSKNMKQRKYINR